MPGPSARATPYGSAGRPFAVASGSASSSGTSGRASATTADRSGWRRSSARERACPFRRTILRHDLGSLKPVASNPELAILLLGVWSDGSGQLRHWLGPAGDWLACSHLWSDHRRRVTDESKGRAARGWLES